MNGAAVLAFWLCVSVKKVFYTEGSSLRQDIAKACLKKTIY